MDDNSRGRATAASAPLTFADGTEYQMSPLTDKDIAELDEWVQARSIRIARMSLSAEADAMERRETMSLAMSEASRLTWMAGEGAAVMATLPGMTRLVWQSVKKSHPDVTERMLAEKLFSPENLNAAIDTYEHLNNIGPNLKKTKATRKGRKRKRRRGGKSTRR